VIVLLVSNALVLLALAWFVVGQRPGDPVAPANAATADGLQPLLEDGMQDAPQEAIRRLSQRLRHSTLALEEKLLVYEQLAAQHRRAGNDKEATHFATVASALRLKVWKPEHLLQIAEEHRRAGRGLEERSNLARYLLLAEALPEAQRQRLHEVQRRLADSFREAAESGVAAAEAGVR
jgi:hypothetical protein